MDGEYWYEYIKEHKPDVLGKDIIDYVEQLKLDKESLEKQLPIQGVSYSVAQEYAEFCIKCNKENIPILEIHSYLKHIVTDMVKVSCVN